ncbi:hypothetical protein [Azonexus sp. R2A61]|uniref:hypothetical protein n=1 Tax=Azonexus sp. R2A61 TaxID=2744443 RepID=UPI001F42AE51|nr:hypothetical protein [Azonexus sp. R2A61]
MSNLTPSEHQSIASSHAGDAVKLTRRRVLGALLGLGAAASYLHPNGAQAAAPANRGKIPRLASGKPDFSGIWQTLSEADHGLEPHGNRADAPPGPGVVDGNYIPYLPEALERRRKNFEQRDKLDPTAKGWTPGVPRLAYYPAPFQVFQRKEDITIVPQFGHGVRTIWTNGTRHPDGEAKEYWLGDSRGKWEGDTLVVDVVDFNDETWLDRAGNFHSEALHVVERWKFLDPDTIEYSATLEDPKVYSRPWRLSVLLHRRRDRNFQLIEDYRFTVPYDQYYPPKKP